MISEGCNGSQSRVFRVPALAIVVFVLCLSVDGWCEPAVHVAPAHIASEVVRVSNSPNPAGGTDTWHLEELWTLGGEDEDDFLFGVITQLSIDREGSVYCLDNQLSQVSVFSRDGEFLRTIGSAGEGPGEVTNPLSMVLLPTGDIGLVKALPGKLVLLRSEGVPSGEFVPHEYDPSRGAIGLLYKCIAAESRFVFAGAQLKVDSEDGTQGRSFHIRSYGQDGQRITEFYTKQVSWNASDLVLREIDSDFPWQRFDVDKHGRVAIARERNDYEISIYEPDGAIYRIIEMDYDSYMRAPDQKAVYNKAFRSRARQLPGVSRIETEACEPDIEELRYADDGTIWTQSSRQRWASKEGEFCFNVFSEDGTFEKVVRIICPGSAWEDRLFFGPGNRVYKVSGFLSAALGAQGLRSTSVDTEPEPMTITCYQVK